MSSGTESSAKVYNIQNSTNLVAVFMMILSSIFGLIFNLAIVYVFASEKKQRTSFNLICVFRSVNNSIALIVPFLTVYVPIAVIGSSFYPNWLESLLLCISLNIFVMNEFQSIYISLNRFTAIFLPLRYQKICSIKVTVIVNCLIVADRIRNIAFETYQRIQSDSYILFSPEHLTYSLTSIELSGSNMIIVVSAIFCVALAANIATFLRITVFYLKQRTSRDEQKWRKVKSNMKLFIQTVLQDALFLLDTVFTFQLSGIMTNRFWTFICDSFVWQTIHVMDGFIMLMFNERLSLLKKSVFPSVLATPAEPTKQMFTVTGGHAYVV
ncbi:unnamed protein product [Caenorhabditis sp. 36 PRJEB53466]|nr:unnamed protein product [Caenorhabditis sp. 36 PRJEB53466]